jgi:hypothetical protein
MMNDFTKEELQMLIEAMDRVIEFTMVWDEPKHFNVTSKLRSLIDNYDKDKKVKDALNYIVLKSREWKLTL